MELVLKLEGTLWSSSEYLLILHVNVKSLSPVWLPDPMDCSLSGSSVHAIFHARVLEWVARGTSNSHHLNFYSGSDPEWFSMTEQIS